MKMIWLALSLSGQRGQRLAGADFDEDTLLNLAERAQAIGKTHGAAQVADPVLRVLRLCVGNIGAGAVGGASASVI